MKQLYSTAIAAEIMSTILFFVHINYKPLGSDFMFAILIASLAASSFLLWQSFRNPVITGTLKIIGIACAALPLLWLLLFVKQFI
jgi:hypothetical protein